MGLRFERVWGIFRVQGLGLEGFGVWCLGFRIKDPGFIRVLQSVRVRAWHGHQLQASAAFAVASEPQPRLVWRRACACDQRGEEGGRSHGAGVDPGVRRRHTRCQVRNSVFSLDLSLSGVGEGCWFHGSTVHVLLLVPTPTHS
jgi:hypothetical protein